MKPRHTNDETTLKTMKAPCGTTIASHCESYRSPPTEISVRPWLVTDWRLRTNSLDENHHILYKKGMKQILVLCGAAEGTAEKGIQDYVERIFRTVIIDIN